MAINPRSATTSKMGWGFSPSRAALVTPNDTNDLAFIATSLIIGTSGNIKVTTTGGDTITIPAVPVGRFDLQVTRVWATGTTASGIVALGV